MPEENPRYSRITDILDIIILMQARVQGISIDDIQKTYSASRSTAERMLECVKIAVPQVQEIENFSSKKKYWGFKNAYMREIINFTPEEIANLEKMKEYQEQNGFEDKERLFEKTVDKIKAFSRKHNTNIDNSVEILMQTEGFAVKQMPKYKIDLNILSTIREAMKSNKKITARYNDKDKILSPYGLIYGDKIYLIGVEENKGEKPYCYLLHKFFDVKLTKENFDKGDFNLDEFSKKSFGVYHGEIMDVKLLFSKEVAEDVKNFNFHSTQKMKENEDGTITVKFKASGEYEIMWHLFKWGADIKILSPKSLQKQYMELLSNTLNKQKEK